jgi:serine phosphatase RsbU (regulator of sigma subunit)
LTKGDRLTVCNAGHPRPFWYRAETQQWSILGAQESTGAESIGNLPLGIDESEAFVQMEIVLNRGDLAFFYTDALTEATDRDGRALGEAGLFALIRDLDASDPTSMSHHVVARLDAYRGGQPADDDLTFLLLHHNAGGPPRLTLGQTLHVYARVLGLERV